MKGVSPVISFVMIFGIVLTAAATMWIWARPMVEEIAEKGKIKQMETQMLTLDSIIKDCVRGDYNTTHTIKMYLPNAFLEVDGKNDRIRLTFIQKQLIIGVPNTTTNTVCNESTQLVYDNATYITVFKWVDDVYKGASGVYGKAEILLCYPNIDIVQGGCIAGSQGLLTVTVRKIGYNVTSEKPIVEVGIC